MKTYSKKELRSLVKEVVKKRWFGILPDPNYKRPLPQVYDEMDKWEEDMLDLNNIYIGPDLKGENFHFQRGKPVAETGSNDMLEKVMSWNDALGQKYSIPWEEVRKANDRLSSSYYRDYPEDVLGGFPA